MLRSPQAAGKTAARTAATVASAALIAAATGLAAAAGTDWSAPPRYDGAGYAVLARAILEGQGYRAIDHPDRPRHAHFPPGYPLVLAAAWRITGISPLAARAVSLACTVGATLAAWCWFRRLVPARAALVMAMALALNWLWARTGAAIQSEPLYLLLGQLAILVASVPGRDPAGRGWVIRPVMLGTLLAAAILTRHVAVGLAWAVLIDRALARRWREAIVIAVVCVVLVLPWIAWVLSIGPEGRSQASLALGGGSLPARIAGQFLYYLQRIPDALTGPFVEVGTTFRHDRRLAVAANLWALAATAVIALGWIRALRRPRQRLAALAAGCTLAVLLAWPFAEAGRLLIPLIPCLLVGAVDGLAFLGRWPEWASRRLNARRARLIASALVLAAALPYSMYATIAGKSWVSTPAERDFDAACAWLAGQADHPGPVLTRHPGEVFWRTGRPALEVPTSERPGDIDADAGTIARTIAAHRVAYLLIDRNRYANAPPSPLEGFVTTYPERVRAVWGRRDDSAAFTIYEVDPVR
ncbi:MAG: ArnT family glycosyltransferase [Isosphaeraceae bacterium]